MGDVTEVATAIYGEARGESLEGQLAVGAVIQNRHFGPIPHLKGKTLTETVSKPGAFVGYHVIRNNINTNSPAWNNAFTIAGWVVNNTCPDPTGGCTHFDAANSSSIKTFEAWKQSKVGAGKIEIGGHIFAKEFSREDKTEPVYNPNATIIANSMRSSIFISGPSLSISGQHFTSGASQSQSASGVQPFVGYTLNRGFEIGIAISINNCILF